MSKATDAPRDSRAVYRAISLGAGVQSTVLALLLAHGDERLAALGYPKPDAAIFADTGYEPDYIYRHLDWLEQQLTYPLYRVSGGDLRANLQQGQNTSGNTFSDIPLYVNRNGQQLMLRRQCTSHYKIRPIYRKLRMLAGGQPRRRFPSGQHVELWLGISMDEAQRMKPARERWVVNRWPLVDLRWRRHDCKRWWTTTYPDRQLRRSACIICPFRNDAQWQEMQREEPASYAEAVAYDRSLREPGSPTARRVKGQAYLHKAMEPLDEVIAARDLADRLQQPLPFIADFDNECEGMCGV